MHVLRSWPILKLLMESLLLSEDQGLETPDDFYGESGAGKCEIHAPSENPMDDAQEMTSDFKESGE